MPLRARTTPGRTTGTLRAATARYGSRAGSSSMRKRCGCCSGAGADDTWRQQLSAFGDTPPTCGPSRSRGGRAARRPRSDALADRFPPRGAAAGTVRSPSRAHGGFDPAGQGDGRLPRRAHRTGSGSGVTGTAGSCGARRARPAQETDVVPGWEPPLRRKRCLELHPVALHQSYHFMLHRSYHPMSCSTPHRRRDVLAVPGRRGRRPPLPHIEGVVPRGRHRGKSGGRRRTGASSRARSSWPRHRRHRASGYRHRPAPGSLPRVRIGVGARSGRSGSAARASRRPWSAAGPQASSKAWNRRLASAVGLSGSSPSRPSGGSPTPARSRPPARWRRPRRRRPRRRRPRRGPRGHGDATVPRRLGEGVACRGGGRASAQGFPDPDPGRRGGQGRIPGVPTWMKDARRAAPSKSATGWRPRPTVQTVSRRANE